MFCCLKALSLPLRIPQRVTSDRNYRVSPGTNHSSGDKPRLPTRLLQVTPPVSTDTLSGTRESSPGATFQARDLLHVASRREPEPGTRSCAPARAAGAPPARPHPLPPRPATVAPGCRPRGGRGEVPRRSPPSPTAPPAAPAGREPSP